MPAIKSCPRPKPHSIQQKPKPVPKRRPRPLPGDILEFRQRLLQSINNESAGQDLVQSSQSRALDWRWQRAALIFRTGRRLSRLKHDARIAETCQFIRLALYYKTRKRLEQVFEAMPSVYGAYLFYTSDQPTRRWELEARLLAGEPVESIAQNFATTPETIETYEKLFFNVTDRLHGKSWIMHHAIGRKFHAGLQADDLETVWKYFGYIGGPHVLDALFSKGLDIEQPQSMDGVANYIDQATRASLIAKTTVAIQTTSVDDPKAAIRITKLGQRLKQFHERRRQHEQELAALNSAVDFSMDQIFDCMQTNRPYATGGFVPPRRDNAEVGAVPSDGIVLTVFG